MTKAPIIHHIGEEKLLAVTESNEVVPNLASPILGKSLLVDSIGRQTRRCTGIVALAGCAPGPVVLS